MKSTRQSISDLIKNEPTLVFKTHLSGFPTLYTQEMFPCVAVYSYEEGPNFCSTGQNKSSLLIMVEIAVSAVNEIYQHDRGVNNEDWLNDTAAKIRDLIFANADSLTDVVKMLPTKIQYRIREGNARVAIITVEAEKRYAR